MAFFVLRVIALSTCICQIVSCMLYTPFLTVTAVFLNLPSIAEAHGLSMKLKSALDASCMHHLPSTKPAGHASSTLAFLLSIFVAFSPTLPTCSTLDCVHQSPVGTCDL